jgi:dienelactone hydrolase
MHCTQQIAARVGITGPSSLRLRNQMAARRSAADPDVRRMPVGHLYGAKIGRVITKPVEDSAWMGGHLLEVGQSGHAVPTVLWRPRLEERPPVVLLGHGGDGHKTDEVIVRLAARLVDRGIAAIAIDAPFHGERAPSDGGQRSYLDHVAAQGIASVSDEACADWLAAVGAAGETDAVDTDRVGFIGVSMGSNFGFPTCAQLGITLRCAVLGKLGLTASPGFPAIVAASETVVAAARRLQAPILMHMQWDDEVFSRNSQLDLFDLIASPDKQLRVRPGPHGFTHPDDEQSWISFVSQHLAPLEQAS